MKHIDSIIEDINWVRRLEFAEDGTDVYGMTVWRCLPQFFFYCRLPNQWDDNNGGGWATTHGVNLGGPLLGLALIGFMYGAGAYFMKQEEKRLIKSKLSEEVLLAYFVMKAKNHEAYQGTIRKMDALIERQQKADEDERRRIGAIATFATTHQDALSAILDGEIEQSASTPSGKTSVRRYWETTLDIFTHYAYLHWFLWMTATVVLYQAVEDYGINKADPKHSDAPGWFTDSTLGFSQYDAGMLLETVVPLLVALMIVYKAYQREATKPVIEDDGFLQKQAKIRGFYLDKIAAESGQAVQVTHTHFTTAMTLTTVSTFLSYFILVNMIAWPLQGLAMKVCNVDTPDTTYIPIIFAVATTIALVQASLKLQDMQAENKAHFGQEGKIVVLAEQPKPGLLGAASRVCRFYGDKEHSHKAWYYILGRLMGSGGLLLTRMLYNGGMGNYRSDHINHTNRQDMLEIGLCLTAAFVIFNLVQYYAQAERQAVFKAAGDQKCLSRQRTSSC